MVPCTVHAFSSCSRLCSHCPVRGQSRPMCASGLRWSILLCVRRPSPNVPLMSVESVRYVAWRLTIGPVTHILWPRDALLASLSAASALPPRLGGLPFSRPSFVRSGRGGVRRVRCCVVASSCGGVLVMRPALRGRASLGGMSRLRPCGTSFAEWVGKVLLASSIVLASPGARSQAIVSVADCSRKRL